MTRSGAEEPEVYSITGARPPHSDDLDRRINRYLVSMAIRTVCVVLTIVIPHPTRWLFALGAIFLPYVAVLFANARGVPKEPTPSLGVESRGLQGGPGVRP